MREAMWQLTEFGYLYNSLYAYRRKVEADIKSKIKADSLASLSTADSATQQHDQTLQELTQKLQKISIITSRVISLNKGYRRQVQERPPLG
ncbi:hypothetical protein HUW51_12415 [Adhaeribacter swui]|uniref:Uncharacterized protein n=1 Tax=Adhaeribacter swui TaxID=2086471 RepID=A0A7G7G8K1_9BACT|nr:hypothetical protein [Adhaeribacter swui]QNF33485.1 hypothetical protein HUW51_12415 [Adhaeribacter swui]